MSNFKPLLAATAENFSDLRFPVLASPKLDGIRCLKVQGRALTRKLKEIPNRFVRSWVEANLPDGIDGELMLRDHRIPFGEVSSAIMGRDGEPDFVFQAFDLFDLDETGVVAYFKDQSFQARLSKLVDWTSNVETHDFLDHIMQHFRVVPQVLCNTIIQLEKVVVANLKNGYEGTMVRDPMGVYKFGRSTLREQILVKIKPHFDEEATVIGLVEQMHNTNEAKKDNLGRTKRSTAKAGKVGKDTLGALICVTGDGVQFEIGTGFTDAQRQEIWEAAGFGNIYADDPYGDVPDDNISGRLVKFKHLGRFPDTKVPRCPVFLGWRED